MRPMQIVLPGGLPPAPYAAELAKHLPEHAPSLVMLLGRARTRIEPFDPAAAGCTPFEAWQLAQAGYLGEADKPLGAGLGPLLARTALTHKQPVWVADFVHLALGTDHANLVTAETLAPSRKETGTLLQAIEPVLTEAGYSASLIDAYRMQITLPPGLSPHTASPNTVSGHPLRAWWSTDTASRPWRRLLNEVQMLWHEHPVNEMRQNYGQLPINGLWLYGGARPWPMTRLAGPDAPTVLHNLATPAQTGDWAAWLTALAALEASTFKPLLNDRSGKLQALTLTLMGETRSAHATMARPSIWLRWIPKPTTDWRQWWSLPA